MIRDRSGFSLLEAMIALAIVGVVTLGALGAVQLQQHADGRARARLYTVALAEYSYASLRLDLADGGRSSAADSVILPVPLVEAARRWLGEPTVVAWIGASIHESRVVRVSVRTDWDDLTLEGVLPSSPSARQR